MPLVSVIIPTHNRAKYAIPTIKSILALSTEVEVVVCDTSVIDDISEVLSDCDTGDRVRLVRPSKPMSVVDNFNEALRAASGEYLLFIGDDDFVSSNVVDVAKWAKQECVDAIKFTFPVLYYWPDFEHRTQGDSIAGTLRISPFNGAIEKHDARYALRAALENFGGGVMDMPRAYAGMVSAGLVRSVQGKYGDFFGGVSPDIYSAALISLEVRNCVKMDFPVVIPGASGASTAGQSAKGKHVGGLRDNPHIGAFKELVWDERIPEFYSVPTVWSYSLLKAAERAGVPDHEISFSRLYVKCMVYHPDYRSLVLSSFKQYAKSMPLVWLAKKMLFSSLHELAWVLGKLKTKFVSPKAEVLFANLPDSQQAGAVFERWMKSNPVNIRF